MEKKRNGRAIETYNIVRMVKSPRRTRVNDVRRIYKKIGI